MYKWYLRTGKKMWSILFYCKDWIISASLNCNQNTHQPDPHVSSFYLLVPRRKWDLQVVKPTLLRKNKNSTSGFCSNFKNLLLQTTSLLTTLYNALGYIWLVWVQNVTRKLFHPSWYLTFSGTASGSKISAKKIIAFSTSSKVLKNPQVMIDCKLNDFQSCIYFATSSL